MIFDAQAGAPFAPPDSPVVLTKVGQLDPHHIDTVVFGVSPAGADSTVTVAALMACNDDVNAPSVAVTVAQTNFPPGEPCNVDQCAGYLRDHLDTGLCAQPGCGHSSDHHGPGQHCRMDACPGFIAGDGRNNGSGVCAQPGCGHDATAHGPKEGDKIHKDFDKAHKDTDKTSKDTEKHSLHEKPAEFAQTHGFPQPGPHEMVVDPSAGVAHTAAELEHFIGPQLRPDVSAIPLRHQDDAG